jgi:hypothetical protein
MDENETSFQALVPPNLFQSGTNEIDIVLIDGDDVSFVPRR